MNESCSVRNAIFKQQVTNGMPQMNICSFVHLFILCYNFIVIIRAGKKKMSRLSIELTPEQHQKIKAIAAMQGKSIKEYVLNQILPTSSDEEMALHELEAFLDERVKSAKTRKISQKSVKEIFQEVYSESAK